ncbi:MAG: alpha/beta hydrolase [Ruminococcus sp.]|nr:alpha/beta hydrolase [Ruminococcus sp.]
MEFHIQGQFGNPVILMIHGVMTPYEIMLPITEHFTDKYRVIIPALDGHTKREPSTFISIENEAKKIENYLKEKDISEIFCVCGFSLGGAIAHKLLSRGNIMIHNIVLDGAPLVKSPTLLTRIMTSNYLDILRKSKARDKKTLDNFCRHFLPECYLPHYLEFIDKMSEESIINILDSVGDSTLDTNLDLIETNLLYLHGTKMNEYLSKKSANVIAKVYPEATVVCFKGDTHCQCAIYEPDDWAQVVLDFISRT